MTTYEEFKEALLRAGFSLWYGSKGLDHESFKKDGIIVKREVKNISNVRYRVYRRTERGGYKKLHHERTLDCAYRCATTSLGSQVVRVNKIKPRKLKGNTAIYVGTYETHKTYCIKHQVCMVIVAPAVLDLETGIASTDRGEIAKPNTKIWWVASCSSPSGSSFAIITDEEEFYGIEKKDGIYQWKLVNDFPTKSVKLDEMSKTDVYLIAFAIDEFKKEIANG